MFEFLTGNDVYAHVLMLKSASTNPVLIVEGPSDSKALSPHVIASNIAIIVSWGRNKSEQVMSLVAANGVDKVAALIDRDLDDEIGRPTFSVPGIIRTEYRDLEFDMYMTEGVADRLLTELLEQGPSPRLDHQELFAVSIEVPSLLGHLSLLSIRHGWEISLRDLPVQTFLANEAGQYDLAGRAAMILSKSTRPAVAEEDLQNVIDRYVSDTGPRRPELCSGHDLLATLSAVARRWLGITLTAEHAGMMLRLAFTCEHFLKTKVYAQLSELAEQWGTAVISCPQGNLIRV